MPAVNYDPTSPTAGLTEPGKSSFTITPSDSTELTYFTRALLLQNAGLVAVVYLDGSTDTVPLQAGFNPLRVKKVMATGTDAGLNIHGVV